MFVLDVFTPPHTLLHQERRVCNEPKAAPVSFAQTRVGLAIPCLHDTAAPHVRGQDEEFP